MCLVFVCSCLGLGLGRLVHVCVVCPCLGLDLGLGLGPCSLCQLSYGSAIPVTSALARWGACRSYCRSSPSTAPTVHAKTCGSHDAAVTSSCLFMLCPIVHLLVCRLMNCVLVLIGSNSLAMDPADYLP